ncbi:hypothetical protein J6590_023467 [Homalodisca vitripennis]|nr:hypothetical protein J6590_023467 [Homalodisca vitripennis]
MVRFGIGMVRRAGREQRQKSGTTREMKKSERRFGKPSFGSASVAYITGAQKCPKSHAAWIEAVGRFRDDYKHNITEFLEFVGPYTGIDLAESFNSTESIWMAIYTMWESIYTVIEEGLPLPSWTDKIYPQPLTFLADQLLRASSAGSDTQIRYVEGEYFNTVVSLMKAKIEGTLRPDRTMFYFSGHDFTLLGLQGVLGLAQDPSGRLNARTGSALIIELHKNLQSNNFYVQVLYIDGASPDLQPLDINIPGCDSPCDFHLLSNITEKYYNITDWEKECQNIDH